MQRTNIATEKQLRCIRVLSKKLGRQLPGNLYRLSRREASDCIKELTGSVGSTMGSPTALKFGITGMVMATVMVIAEMLWFVLAWRQS